MNRHFILTVVLLLANVLAMKAGGPEYASALLRRSAEALNLSIGEMQAGSERRISKGANTIVVRTDELGEVEHIGVMVFPAQMRLAEQTAVYDYIEFALMNHLYDIDARTKESYELTFRKGSWDALLRGMGDASVTVSRIEDKLYNVVCSKNGSDVADIVFPVRYDHLLRSTMEEQESRFLRRVVAFKDDAQTAMLEPTNLTASGRRGIQQTNGESFQISGVTNTLYYNKREKLVFDRNNPDLSLLNLLLTADSSLPNKHLRLSQRFDNKYATLPLSRFVAFMRSQHLQLFAGIKSVDGQNVTATLYAVNRAVGYFHMFSIACTVDDLMRNEGEINVKSQLFIPIN